MRPFHRLMVPGQVRSCCPEMLVNRLVQNCRRDASRVPDLQRPRSQNSCTLVLRQVWCCHAHFVWLPFSLCGGPGCLSWRWLAIRLFLGVCTVRAGVAICLLALSGVLAVRELCSKQVVVFVLRPCMEGLKACAEAMGADYTHKSILIEAI